MKSAGGVDGYERRDSCTVYNVWLQSSRSKARHRVSLRYLNFYVHNVLFCCTKSCGINKDKKLQYTLQYTPPPHLPPWTLRRAPLTIAAMDPLYRYSALLQLHEKLLE